MCSRSKSSIVCCLLTVLQVVDDPWDGLLSCGAHCTLCGDRTGKTKTSVWGCQQLYLWGLDANTDDNRMLLFKGDVYETDGSNLQLWQDVSQSKLLQNTHLWRGSASITGILELFENYVLQILSFRLCLLDIKIYWIVNNLLNTFSIIKK